MPSLHLLTPPLLTLRRPATPAYIARRLARIAWFEGKPSPHSRAWLIETCRAELEWATAEWRHLTGDPGERAWGAGLAEAWRLPHEHAAARVVNCHLHFVPERAQLDALRDRLRTQRRQSLDRRRKPADRLYWADAAARTLGDYRGHLVRRRLAWRGFVDAAAEYRRLKALMEKADLDLAA